MTSRQWLYLILSFVVTLVLVMLVVVTVVMLDKQSRKQDIAFPTTEDDSSKEVKKRKGKYEGKEARAIKLLTEYNVPAPKPKEDPNPSKTPTEPDTQEGPSEITLGQLAKDGFFDSTFKLKGYAANGWSAKYLKKAYYFVSYGYQDNLVNLGPTWLVSVKSGRIIPKNTMALLAMNPNKIETKDYFEREQQVVSAITNNTFPSGITLAGVVLVHFASRKNASAQDILGWTIVHDHGDIYRAYFQWTQDGEPTYAEFEFDYANKALRGRNLQAANLMNIGRDFETVERVNILPLSYNPAADNPSERWLGPTRNACASPQLRDRCQVMDNLYQDRKLIDAVGWLLASEVDNAGQFQKCKTSRHCCWKVDPQDDGTYKVIYGYDLNNSITMAEGERTCKAAEGKHTASWIINPKTKSITPANPVATQAYRAVHPRSGASL